MTPNKSDEERNFLFLFDLDGTLLDTVDYHLVAYNNTFKIHFGISNLEKSQITPFFGLPLKNVLAGIFKATGIQSNEKNFETARKGYIEHLSLILESLTDKDVYPGVFELLEELQRKNIAMAIITGNPRITGEIIVKKTGLNSYFPDEMRFFSHESRVADRSILIHQARGKYSSSFLDKDPLILVIGDTPHDIKAGKQTGCLTAAVLYKNRFFERNVLEKAGADYIIADPVDFISLLETVQTKNVI